LNVIQWLIVINNSTNQYAISYQSSVTTVSLYCTLFEILRWHFSCYNYHPNFLVFESWHNFEGRARSLAMI